MVYRYEKMATPELVVGPGFGVGVPVIRRIEAEHPADDVLEPVLQIVPSFGVQFRQSESLWGSLQLSFALSFDRNAAHLDGGSGAAARAGLNYAF